MLRCCSLLMRSHLLAGQKLSADVAWNDFLDADVKPCPSNQAIRTRHQLGRVMSCMVLYSSPWD